MRLQCAACDHFGYTQTGNDTGPPKVHEQVFTDSESQLSFCTEHTSAYISWLMDGGIVEEPDMWAWVNE